MKWCNERFRKIPIYVRNWKLSVKDIIAYDGEFRKDFLFHRTSSRIVYYLEYTKYGSLTEPLLKNYELQLDSAAWLSCLSILLLI